MTEALKQIEEILYEGLTSIEDPQLRTQFLEQTCHGNAELRSRLEQLISVRDEAESFFQTDSAGSTRVPDLMDEMLPASGADSQERLGTRVGRYRLLQRIGEGGGGAVYQAEQIEPVRRMVALKILRVGLDSAQLIARFEMERQSLAVMNHPNIARVLDAGTTASGRPFFVMEMVEGLPMTTFCDEHRLDLTERLRLFIPVCMAIQHAHQKGIIHCDIKPSNVMVTMQDGKPVPRVIDFGIARAVGGGQDEAQGLEAAPLIGTPVYMSPEQVEGKSRDVDTRSDIFSLGALLHEVLTGCPPRDPQLFRHAESEVIRKLMKEQTVSKPSQLFAALPSETRHECSVARRSDPAQLQNQLKGDLDAIIMKAMETTPQRRYGAAGELAADVSRYLTCEPVMARRGAGGRYRLGKLIRRNKIAFTAGTIAFLGLGFGFGTSTWLLVREARAREEQARLRQTAELARANEAKLRRKAQAGELVAHAAVQISHDQIPEADALLSKIAMEDVPSSLESANTFRQAGEWLLREGRMQDASMRFSAVAQAISRVDQSESEAISLYFVTAAAAVVDSGDIEHYEELRQMAAERFSNPTHPVISDEVVKACLIRPAPPALLEKIEPLVNIMESHLPWDREDRPDEIMEGWQMLSLTLANYRKGDFNRAESWARRCLRHPNANAARAAAVRALLAMTLEQAGHPGDASQELETARTDVNRYFQNSPKIQTQWTDQGFWFDWMIARILVKEADSLLRK